jgi:septum formation protein
MLEAAGLPVETSLPDLDERAVEAAGPLGPAEAAVLLAREKAKAVARNKPGRLVVGADQTLAFGDRRFDKPGDRVAARAQLRCFRQDPSPPFGGRRRARRRGAVCCRDTASLTMRSLSDAFLDAYFDAAGAAVLESVGAYQLEKLGIHLFERIEGDHFTILGLPLLELIAFLRQHGSLAG